MLTDNELSQKQGRNPRRRSASPIAAKRPWSDAQKIEAVTLWLSLGNLNLVGATLKIPEDTLRRWKATTWWKEVADEIALQDRIQLSATAKNIVDKSLGVIADRLENGDWIYDQKVGQLRRKPVAMKDALAVADRMLDRKDQLDKVQVIGATTESVEQKLNKLMEKFAQIASPAVTDVIYVEKENASDEERQTGLQLRQGISEETGTGEEPGSEEFGEEDN